MSGRFVLSSIREDANEERMQIKTRCRNRRKRRIAGLQVSKGNAVCDERCVAARTGAEFLAPTRFSWKISQSSVFVTDDE